MSLQLARKHKIQEQKRKKIKRKATVCCDYSQDGGNTMHVLNIDLLDLSAFQRLPSRAISALRPPHALDAGLAWAVGSCAHSGCGWPRARLSFPGDVGRWLHF